MSETPAAAPAAPSSSSSTASTSSAPSGQSQGSQQTAGQGSPPPPAAPPSRQKWKDTIDGKEVEFEASEDELRAHYRKAKAADQRFEAAAKLRKEAESQRQSLDALKAEFKKNPRSVTKFLRDSGIDDPLDFMANALQGELAEEERLQDPNVRARVEAEEKLRAFEEKEAAAQQERQQAEFRADVDATLERIGATFEAALKEFDLPKDDDTFAIMAALESENRRRGLDLSPKRLAELTKERVLVRGGNVMKKLPGAQLLKLDPELTKAFAKAIRDDYESRRRGVTSPPTPQSSPTSAQRQESRESLTEKEAHEARWGKRVLRTI